MQIINRSLPIANSTLRTLINELGIECQNITALIHQLQSPHLSDRQQAEILAELLTATIHLNVHCGEDFQELIAEEMEKLPDDDEL
ncbi:MULTISPECIES: hypothetical protein [Sphaerospermopsis]|jgi:hypothetical protein|uniref:Uncharacterized protein n=1 Tax=Sphaerospermopsis torques-reginae ITEP-024 TaxID=984208 RepID=A0ABX8WW59_9CYAN|nr:MULTISPECIES: hypothetical protein [Sphaerospermopsis]MBE9056290.1 hypothetical protein [Sphaerospermopsis sp. LEGE 08334]QYX30660.1 hypothetical protein K2F26_17485 [Sphaerospermopsis torques-reginae ITEP-024]